MPLTADAHASGTDPSSLVTGCPAAFHATAAPPSPVMKFRPPRRRRQVHRSRLIDVLRAQWPRRLTVIHAPTGYGKTTLAAQWGAQLACGGVKVAWLAIDDNDNNSIWFLANLLEAIRLVDPPAVGDLGAALEEHGRNIEQFVLTSLVNQIGQRDQPVTLIIDDWHRVNSVAVINAMGFLLEYGTDNLQVVVTSRSRSGLPLSQMRVHDELIEIDVDALCFDTTETRSFLIDVSGLGLEAADIADLCDSTDGWIAGLQLATLSIRGADNASEMISQISGRHHAIAEYLTENVLNTLEPKMLHFLLTTSITERICGSLASVLSGETHGQAMLEEVEVRDLFLRRCDENGDWFRYHHLFVEFLRRRLGCDHPGMIAALHRCASDWFADQHMLVEAIDHALAAGDPRRGVELIELDGQRLLAHSQIATLFGLVDKLPSEEVVSSPELQIVVAWANIFLQRCERARAALELVDSALTTRQRSGIDVTDLRAIARVVEATIYAYTDHIDDVEDLVSECLARPEAFPPFAVSVAANLMTHSALYRFDFDTAHRWQEWARPYHARNRGPYVPVFGHARDGLAALEQLDLDRAEGCLRTAWRMASRSGAVDSQAARLVSGPLAEVLYERGEIAEAQRLSDESFKLDAEEGMVDWIRSRFIVGARLAVLRGDKGAAAELLDKCAETAQRLSLPRLSASAENERVLLGLPTQRVTRLPVQFAQRQWPVDGIVGMIAQLEEDTAIRLLIADSPTDEQVDLASRWAREWVDHLQGLGRDRALLRAERTLVECLLAAGRRAEAQRLLSSILVRCKDVGLVRFPLDGGPRLTAAMLELRNNLRGGTADSTMAQPPVWLLDRILPKMASGEAAHPDAAGTVEDAAAVPPFRPCLQPVGRQRLFVLGSGRPRWSTIDSNGRFKFGSLAGRHADILVLLGQHPEGLTADHLAMLLDEDGLDSVTVRAEILRLRKAIGAEFFGSRPYRLLHPIGSDLEDTLTALESGDVEAALSYYCGPLLPRSVSPAIARLRTQLSTSVRRAAISSGNLAVLRRWLDTPEGRDDYDGWRILHESSSADPVSRAWAEGHLAGIDHALG